MVKTDLSRRRLVIQIKQNMFFLNYGDVGKIDAGKSIVAFGPLFFTSGTGNYLAVKYDADSIGSFAGGETLDRVLLILASVFSISMGFWAPVITMGFKES